jgi:hypothetical protein
MAPFQATNLHGDPFRTVGGCFAFDRQMDDRFAAARAGNENFALGF